MRVLDINVGSHQLGMFTKSPGALTNDFFVNLLDRSTEWQKSPKCEHFFIVSSKTYDVGWLSGSVLALSILGLFIPIWIGISLANRLRRWAWTSRNSTAILG